MTKKRVLFVCTHNSARSQMAEAWLKQIGGKDFAAESAGLDPGAVKPLVIAVMGEAGLDISKNRTQSVFEICKSGRRFDFVIALLDEEKAKRSPTFPAETKMLRWEFPERPKVTKAAGEELEHYRKVRDMIRDRVKEWMEEES